MTDAETIAELRAILAAREAENRELRRIVMEDIAAWRELAERRWGNTVPATIVVTWPSE